MSQMKNESMISVVHNLVMSERWEELRVVLKRYRNELTESERWHVIVFMSDLMKQTGLRP